MRPRNLEEFIGQRRLLGPGSPLRRLVDEQGHGSRSSVILWGPPGTGKTTLAHMMARAGGSKFVELSAITAGIKDVREVIGAAHEQQSAFGTNTVLFIDEVHRFNKTQQDALLPGVENGWVTLVAATTENPSFSVIAPLLSRSLLVTLDSLSDEEIVDVLQRAANDARGLAGQAALLPDAVTALTRLAGGDARRALTVLEAAFAVAQDRGSREIDIADVEQASDHSIVRYDKAGDQHYDVISAFIKSVRGSDPDAALHYLARMLEAGEDPRFIARRLVILASEDIGLADNSMLSLTVAAAHTVQLIGMPEARITLGHATVALALAPKSNSAYRAIDAAIADIRTNGAGEVPRHLRDSHYARAGDLGHGVGYVYPHDTAQGVAQQTYLPEALADARYYEPGARGGESPTLLERIRALLGRH